MNRFQKIKKSEKEINHSQHCMWFIESEKINSLFQWSFIHMILMIWFDEIFMLLWFNTLKTFVIHQSSFFLNRSLVSLLMNNLALSLLQRKFHSMNCLNESWMKPLLFNKMTMMFSISTGFLFWFPMTLSSLSSKECHWNFICIVKFDDLQREKKKK
jgi:hypothetical protein